MRLKPVRLHQQPEKVKDAMTKANLSHGQEVRTTINKAFMSRGGRDCGSMLLLMIDGTIGYLIRSVFRTQKIYFCRIQPLEIVETISPGDEGAIPREMKMDSRLTRTLRKLHLKPGDEFDIVDAMLTSNGSIQLSADVLTKLVTRKTKKRDAQEVLVIR